MRPRPQLLRTIVGWLVVGSVPVARGATEKGFPPHAFTLPDGYTLERAAGPPLVQRPIHMAFDDDGVLYVTDSSGNTDNAPAQLENPSHRIVRLVDRDGDGSFDSSTVFAERLPFPEGILVRGGAVYVGAPPHIWRFRDRDGDHVADEREVWFDGGSIGGCGNDMHGPYAGPDGYFYWCKGEFQRQRHRLADGRVLDTSAAHVFRARPDGSGLEVVLTGGMNNPVGIAFSATGERFLSGTFFDLSRPGRRDGVLHAVYGGMYGKRNEGVLAKHPSTGALLPVLAQMGPAAPSGIVMPKGEALGLRGDLLCADFNLRRVSRHRLARSGSSYTAETRPFLESDQSDFHPTDVIEDADGTLLVADTGSWYKICCPTSRVAKPEVLGAIYRIGREGAAFPEDPRGRRLDWGEPEIGWLADRRPAVVRRAVDALAERGDVDGLRSAEARVPAVWALHRIDGGEARAALREFLDDREPDACAAAIHSSALWRDREAAAPLVGLLGSADARIRRLAAMALGRIGDGGAAAPLLDAFDGAADPFLRHAITYALYEIGDGGRLPDRHPVADQVRRMWELDRREPSPHAMPEIRMADAVDLGPGEAARRRARLDELAAHLPTGDAGRGAELFRDAAKSLCVTCHVMGERGEPFGPDLTSIGAIRSERDLLEAIVYPSASIARYYESVTVETEEGEVSGLLRKDSPDQITLTPAPGAGQAVPVAAVEGARYSNVSLMPAVFDGLLQPREIADMVAYLKEAKLPSPSAIPPHQELTLPGLHAYAQKSIAAGDDIEFRVSSSVPYRLNVVRLGPDPEDREGDPVLHRFPEAPPRTQPIHPGSYVHVDQPLPAAGPLASLTLECWIRPFALAGWQGLITQHDYPDRCGVGLFLNGDRIAFLTGAGGAFDRAALHETGPGLVEARRWQHLVASWDGKTKRVHLDGELVAEFPFGGVVRPARTALRLGAYASDGAAANFYNGDLAMCAVYGRALGDTEIGERFADRGLSRPREGGLLACWPFREERGIGVADAGPHRRNGQIINRGTWMIGGPSFDAAGVGRHDRDYDPTADPHRGHGLRLAADELYNARWDVTHRFRIPPGAGSGVYAGRFDFEVNGEPMRYHATFVVRRPAARPKAPLLVLVSSNTWLAYNSSPFPINHGPGLINMGTGGLRSCHPGAPTYSCYSDHRHGQPAYKIGMKVPWPAAGPNKTYIGGGYSHLLRGERFLHLWLDRHGYDYDVVTDHDLDRDPGLLEGYKAVCINGHSEYWSARAYEGLERYLEGGGCALVTSGNTMFWRVSFDEGGEVMECRKFGGQIGGRRFARVGELYHSHDFKRGSLMRFCGYPAWELVGLTCIGWSGLDFKPYQVDLPGHFLFNEPNEVGLGEGDAFGFVTVNLGAVGHEYDVRLSTLLDATPDPAIKGLAEPDGIVTIASSRDRRHVLDFNAEGHRPRSGDGEAIAEMIYWERPGGGRVFHTGSIATAWSLFHDEALSKLVNNVLHHFGVEPKDTEAAGR